MTCSLTSHMSAKMDPVKSTSEADVASQCSALGTVDGKSEDTQAEDHLPEDCENNKRLDELVAQVEALAVPGYTVREEGVFTVIRRTRRVGRNNTYLWNILRWLLRSPKWLPTLTRFMRDSFGLAPWRMCLLVLSKLLVSITPAMRLWATTRLLGMVEMAIATGEVDKMRIGALVIASGLMGPGLRQFQLLFSKNTGILERKYGAMIVSRILKTMAILDWPARSNPYNNRLINDAANMAQGSSSQAFKILTDIVRVFTITAGTVAQMAFLKRALTSENGDLFAMGILTNLLSTGNWLLQGDNGIQWAVTNTDYQRMQHIWKDSTGSPESILLDLPRYLHGEFQKANEKLGDVATSRIGEVNRVAQAVKILNSFSQPLLYALFALRAAAHRGKARRPSLFFQATFSTSALYAIESATAALTDEIGGLFCVLESVRGHCANVLRFYRCLDLKPELPFPEVPHPYVTQEAAKQVDRPVSKGMCIEFRDVDFAYANSNRQALNEVNFKIAAGSLVCIVGYNGAGKSTLINLMTRLADPTAGSVFINGVDAKDYSPRDLHNHISCQFQETPLLQCTIREWLHMGDISDDDDEEKMKECLRLAGADKIVAKFPKGLDGRLGPYPAAATPQSLLKDFVEEDLEVCLDTETTATFKPFEEESFGHTALPTRFANIDCDFSPGEWSKMCFARSLMRQTADLRIFDEPTSKMDPIASRAVFEKIESLRGSCTIVHITHDLSACLRADQVILFENGTNVEAGTHHELLAKAESRYRQFYLASIGRDEYQDDQEWETKDEHCDLDDALHSQLDAPAQAISGDTLLEQLEEGLNPGGRGTIHLQVPSLAAFRKVMHDEADTSHETEYDSGYDGSSASSSC